MARNRSEKDPEPVLEGYASWLMEPIRLDALYKQQLDGLNSAGDDAFFDWTDGQREIYMAIDEDTRKDCYDAWMAYYDRHPEKRVPL